MHFDIANTEKYNKIGFATASQRKFLSVSLFCKYAFRFPISTNKTKKNICYCLFLYFEINNEILKL